MAVALPNPLEIQQRMNAPAVLDLSSQESQIPGSAAERQQLILQAASELVVKIGYRAITMTGLADYAGISRGTLYRYYSTKEQLFSDASMQWAQSFVGSLHKVSPAPTVGERLCKNIEQAVGIIVDNPKMVSAYIETLTTEGSRDEPDHLGIHIPDVLQLAAGDLQPKYKAQADSAMRHLILSNIILLNTGKVAPETVIEEITELAKLLLFDVWDCA